VSQLRGPVALEKSLSRWRLPSLSLRLPHVTVTIHADLLSLWFTTNPSGPEAGSATRTSFTAVAVAVAVAAELASSGRLWSVDWRNGAGSPVVSVSMLTRRLASRLVAVWPVVTVLVAVVAWSATRRLGMVLSGHTHVPTPLIRSLLCLLQTQCQ